MANSYKSDYQFWPKCTCNRRCDLDSDTPYDDDYDDSFYIDKKNKDESSSSKKIFFISVYQSTFTNTIIISDAHEIEMYRSKYSELTDKSEANIKNIWGDIVVTIPMLGSITLKTCAKKFFKGSNKRKKQLKKPFLSMKFNTNSNSSEKSDTINTEKSCSTMQLEKDKENLKEENNNLNKKNIDKVQEVRTNSICQSEDKRTNIKIENKLDINNKILKTVNNADKNTELQTNITVTSKELDKESKNQTLVNNTKSSANKGQKSNSTLANNIKANINKEVNLENENESKSKNINENKDKEKSNSVNQNSTPKKSNMLNKNENINLRNDISKAANTPDKVPKINTSNQSSKNEIKNSVNEPKSSNVDEKCEKKDLENTPSKRINTVDKNKHTNPNVNNSTKQTVSEFKKPLDVKPILHNTEKNNAVKISKKSSTTQVASDDTENNMHEETIDKATKKKLKKQRQKEKKVERSRRDSSNCISSRDTTDNSSPDSTNKNFNKSNKINTEELKKTGKKQEEKQVKSSDKNHSKIDTEESEVEKDEDQSEQTRTSDEVDFWTDDENIPVFLAKIKDKCKNKKKTKVNADASTKINSNSTETTDLANGNEEQEFVIYSKKRNKISNHVIDQNSIFYSENFAENACHMISENNFMGALECLVDAIDFNYTDQRHYLNRCYCYLSMKKNALALADAEYVIQISSNIDYRFIATIRAAQASYGLQKYDQAETYMKEAIRINPTSMYLPRELILIQVAKIVSMGFTEKNALLALEKYSSIKEAVNYLIENNTDMLNNSKKEDLEISLDSCDEFVYSSDEDELSNAEIVNRMLNYKPGTVTFQHIVAKLTNVHHLVCDNDKSIKKEKKIVLNGKANSEQAKAIWVGNLTRSITDSMLKNKFKEYGKVISVYHPHNEAYAFINFEKAEDVINVLTNTLRHEVAGVKLIVRSAVRQK